MQRINTINEVARSVIAGNVKWEDAFSSFSSRIDRKTLARRIYSFSENDLVLRRRAMTFIMASSSSGNPKRINREGDGGAVRSLFLGLAVLMALILFSTC